MSRPQINYQNTSARFREGTIERIDAVLRDGEKRAEFIRSAIERELERREALLSRRRKKRS